MPFALKAESHVACIKDMLGKMDQILHINHKGLISDGRLQGLVSIAALQNVLYCV